MPCIEVRPGVIACTSGVREIRRLVKPCPVCERRRRMVLVCPDNPYYSPTFHCLGCGDSWTDGERHERPFRRGWRDEARAKAKDYWANAFQQTAEEKAAWQEFWFPPR